MRVEIGFGGLVAAHRRKGHEEPSHDESFLEEGNRPLAVSGLRIVGPRALVSRRTPAYQSRSIFMSCGCDLPHPSLSEKSCSPRSEEHTSELQSLMRISYAVFCLKKKNKKTNTHTSKYEISH